MRPGCEPSAMSSGSWRRCREAATPVFPMNRPRDPHSPPDVDDVEPRPPTGGERFRLWLSTALIRWSITALATTWRLEVVEGAERVATMARDREPAILAFWHGGLPVIAYWLHVALVQRRYPLTLLTSRSRDGEIGALLAKMWGADVIRGSSSRGGSSALRELYRAVKKRGRSPVIVADGPRGPLRRAKPGAVILATTTGVPIVPIASAATRAWRLRSWDRMVVPKPFARVLIAVGEAHRVAAGLDPEASERERQRIERSINGLAERVEALAGDERRR